MNATYKQVICAKPVIGESFPPSAMYTWMKYTGQQAPGDPAMPSMVSPCSSAFSTPSVADSVEHNEANLQGIDVVDKEAPVMDQKAPVQAAMNDTESDSDKEETPLEVIDKQAPASEQQAPVDSGMPDAEGASQIEEISTGGVVFNPLQQV